MGADRHQIWCGGVLHGAEGARTPDLRHAMAALFQLSYSPGKLVSGGPVYRCALVVSCRAGTQVEPLSAGAVSGRQEIALVEVRAVRGDRVYLSQRVGGPNVAAGRRVVAGAKANPDDIVAKPGP